MAWFTRSLTHPKSWVRVVEEGLSRGAATLDWASTFSVAEWDSGLRFEGALAEIVTPIHGESLQLTDHSFDVVIAGATHKSSAEEALRVATQAIGICQTADKQTSWRSRTRTAPGSSSVSILIPTFDAADHLERCFRSLHETLRPLQSRSRSS